MRILSLAAMSLSLIAAGPPVRLPAGSEVPVVLAHGVSAKTAQTGDRVVLRTLAPVVYKGVVVIPEGATVIGAVARVGESRGGRAGAVEIEAEAIALEEGGRIALDGTLTREGQDYRRSTTGGTSMVGGSLTIPLGRRNATPNLEAGTAFMARTARDY